MFRARYVPPLPELRAARGVTSPAECYHLPMSVSPEQAARKLRADGRARAEAARARADALRSELGGAATLLRAAGARRIWLFGSLSDGAPTRESDVDLGVAGMDPRRYFEVLANLMALFGTRVDLVMMERAPTSLVERIATTGHELP